ncbi:MAG: hypothetical protein MUE45_04895 [Methanoregulaceae archaeon]|jgi:hypothetical protein|nr:hypothetical protein [Methanoregulaceae archaeon]MCU0628807.1 hypothetical protein [Methanoregulaceae archaeon]
MELTASPRTDDQVKEQLKQYLASMDIEIVKEVGNEGNWGIWTKFGNFPVLIDHGKGTHYCVVAFQITLQDEHAITHLNNFYERNDAQFIYELTRAFSSPLTAFSRIIERGRVIGYTVSKHIYPYQPEFNLRTLDIAFQAVVSTGAIGVAFLKWMAKVLDVRHERGIEVQDEDPTKLFE